MRDDPIALVLDDLLKLDDILACMVARRNMISVMPSGDGFDTNVMSIWDILHRAMDDVFNVIREYSAAGLAEMEFRLQDYEALFFVFPDTEANKGLIEVEMENARREILGLMGESEQTSSSEVMAQ